MKPLSLVRIAILTIMVPASMLAAQNPDSASITKLLSEVKSHAALADEDAHTLESYSLSSLHSQTHGNQLNQIRQHVKDLIRDGNELSSMRDDGSPWQQEAIDRINPLLSEMAAHLTATINHLNDNLRQTQMKPFRDLVLTNQTILHNAHKIISDYADYAEAKAKADALEKDFRISAASDTSS